MLVDDMMGQEAAVFLMRITDLLAVKWEDYGSVMGWIRTRLSFVILCATLMCMQGSCTKWCMLGLVDGASIVLLFFIPLFGVATMHLTK